MKPHSTSQTSFDANSDLYDKVRPDYIAEAVEQLADRLNLGQGSKVVELAAGTGKFTQCLLRQARDAGVEYDIEAVEPSGGMRRVFSRNLPDIPIHAGDSYSLPCKDHSADAVIVAQGFHWFADTASLREIARVLNPNGSLGLIWNYEATDDLPDTNLQKRVAEYVHSFSHNVPQYSRMDWRAALLHSSQTHFKVPLNEEHFLFTVRAPCDPEYLWKYWQSRSFITALPEEQQAQVRQRIYDMYNEAAAAANWDPATDHIDLHRGTHIVWLRPQSYL